MCRHLPCWSLSGATDGWSTRVSVSTKMSQVYLFDRESGDSLFPLREIDALASDVPGEQLSETQVVPVVPPPLGRQRLTEADLTDRTPEARDAVLKRFRAIRSDGMFTPPSLQGSIVFPGFDGGAEWGGQAFDPETGLLYVNVNEMAWIHRLVEIDATTGPVTGKRLYQRHCAPCHLDDMSGSPPAFPALSGLEIDETQFASVVRQGAGRMPGFPQLADRSVDAITRFVLQGDMRTRVATDGATGLPPVPFTHDGYNRFLDPDGYPAIAPPWGTLNAVNLNTGEVEWTVRLGRVSRADSPGRPHHGNRELRRTGGHRKRSGLHRCDGSRQEVQGVRQKRRGTCSGRRPCPPEATPRQRCSRRMAARSS